MDDASLCAAFQRTAARVPDRVALRSIDDEVSISWRDYASRVERLAGALAGLGIGTGTSVGLMLNNRPEFHLVDCACLHLGATPVSVYTTLPSADVAWILADAGASVVFTETAFLQTVFEARAHGLGIETVVVVDDDGELTSGHAREARSLVDLEASESPRGFDFGASWRAVKPDDIATLIYTSGTTGPPKGVELSHRAILGTVAGIHEVYGTVDGARVISVLPMAHIGERQISHYRGMVHGFSNTPCPDLRELPTYLGAVRPHYLFAPPRLFEKLQAAVEAGIARESDPLRRQAIETALEIGRRKVDAEQNGEVTEELVAAFERARDEVNIEVLRKLGLDEVAVAMTGGAAVRYDLLEFWHALGLPLTQGWGLSESGGITVFSRPGDRLGTCGRPLPGVEVRLLDDGEILLRSQHLMTEYHNQPEKTRETIDRDGWLHTGDIGRLSEDGQLEIVDRKKELIINAFGKNMSPANIEAKIKDAHPVIGNACVIGDGLRYNAALITLDPDVAPAIGAQLGIDDASAESLASDDRILEIVTTAVQEANERMARVEQVKRFRVLGTDWRPGGDELTPTAKLRRRVIAEKYEAEIAALYADNAEGAPT